VIFSNLATRTRAHSRYPLKPGANVYHRRCCVKGFRYIFSRCVGGEPAFSQVIEAGGGLNRPRDSQSTTAKVADSLAKSKSCGDFIEDKTGPKTSAKDPDNPENPDRVRSTKKNLDADES
jgi:hypothetical protein